MKRIGLALTLGLLWWSGLTASAQSTNGIVTLTHDTLASAGGPMGSGNPLRMVAAMGEPMGGRLANATFTLHAGYWAITPRVTGSQTVIVEGTLDDPTATVTINSLAALITGNTFRADKVPLIEGANTLTATATDPAGNQAVQTITVSLSTRPPARPTLAATPPVITASAYPLSGTKTPGTSVWINGVDVVPLSDTTTWSTPVTLHEGDNVFVVVAKNAAGITSASNTVNMVVDNLPPVITATVPAKTNFNPLTVTGTVDDSLTTIVVNGATAGRSSTNFTADIPITLGSNTITITATSPNGYVSTKTFTTVLGTIPTITVMTPADGTKLYVGTTVTVQAAATDSEGDPLVCQILLDGVVMVDWFAGASHPWTPSLADLGSHMFEVRVRDDFGGYASRQHEVFVIRNPVSPP